MEKSNEFIMKPTVDFCFHISEEMPLKCELPADCRGAHKKFECKSCGNQGDTLNADLTAKKK